MTTRQFIILMIGLSFIGYSSLSSVKEETTSASNREQATFQSKIQDDGFNIKFGAVFGP